MSLHCLIRFTCPRGLSFTSCFCGQSASLESRSESYRISSMHGDCGHGTVRTSPQLPTVNETCLLLFDKKSMRQIA